ncbi:hypothetical protein FACS1894104_5470 [Actinomycetota bacterium]|nr:hypothetical protein FACS1894104_5470 [Actinomycetota bacterium]
MKKNKLVALLVVAVLAISGVLVGCSSPAPATSGSGTTSGTATTGAKTLTPVRIVTIAAQIPSLDAGVDAMAELGYELIPTVIDNAAMSREVVLNGEAEGELWSHFPALQATNQADGKETVMFDEHIYSVQFALYSAKYDKLEQIPNGATIAVAEDPANQGRGLRLLEKLGLITLPADVISPTIYDVQNNPKNIKFVTAQVNVMVSAAEDVDAYALASLFVYNAGLDTEKNLGGSNDLDKYWTSFIVLPENLDADWAKALREVYSRKDIQDAIYDAYGGSFVPWYKVQNGEYVKVG